MKNYLIFLFLIVSIFLNAQVSNSIAINWTDKKEFLVGETIFTIPQFEAINFVFDSSARSILYATKINNVGLVSETDFEILNIITTDIAPNELAELNLKTIPATPNFFVKNIFSRDETSIYISFSPIIKTEGSYKKVLSLNYVLKPVNVGKILNSNNVSTISSSVLSTGKWNRFYVEKSGVYKITKSFLDQIGFNVNGVDPKKIKIYGNGGQMLPLNNAVFYPADLTENAVQIIGESDGVFNNDDYILFYAEGLDNWSSENGTHLNLYENKSFYFVTVDGSDGNRIAAVNQTSAPTTLSVSTYDDVHFHEIDLTNIGKVGRIFFGEPFAVENIQQFDFFIPNINTAAAAQLEVHVGGSSITP
ncbi:MAG: peptidase C25, partial [Flavobacterium sp.]|nr:peptidase C25 [Flavobacterium sp.]